MMLPLYKIKHFLILCWYVLFLSICMFSMKVIWLYIICGRTLAFPGHISIPPSYIVISSLIYIIKLDFYFSWTDWSRNVHLYCLMLTRRTLVILFSSLYLARPSPLRPNLGPKGAAFVALHPRDHDCRPGRPPQAMASRRGGAPLLSKQSAFPCPRATLRGNMPSKVNGTTINL